MRLPYYVEVTGPVAPFTSERMSFVPSALAHQQIMRYWFASAHEAEDGAMILRAACARAEISIVCPARPAEIA